MYFSGTLQYFADVHSARIALGHDKTGRIVLVQIDGKTEESGYEKLSFGQKICC